MTLNLVLCQNKPICQKKLHLFGLDRIQCLSFCKAGLTQQIVLLRLSHFVPRKVFTVPLSAYIGVVTLTWPLGLRFDWILPAQ